MAILERVFKPKLGELRKVIGQVVEVPNASVEDILFALKNPENLGVILLGHPAIKTKGKYPDKKIIHGFLMGADGYYLPKNILSSTHEQLQFLSIMTCHESAILPLYLDSLSEKVDYIKSPTHGLDSLSNPLFEFTSFYSTPLVVDTIIENYKKGKYASFKKNKKIIKGRLTIKLSDLISSRFTYTITIDDKVVGILKSQKNPRGRNLNNIEFSFDLLSHELKTIAPGAILKVLPDDPNRPKPIGLKVLDDIIVREISIDSSEYSFNWKDGAHLGDQAQNPDILEGLGFLRNKFDFDNLPFSENLELSL